MILRDYQQEAVDALFQYWQKNKKPCLLQLATGAGKSIIISEIVKRVNASTLVLQPTKEILEQNYEKLLAAGVPRGALGVCSASAGSWTVGGITLATIGTIKNQLKYCQHFKVVVIDEVDVVPNDRADSMYMKFLNALPNVKIVGLTATPWRNQTFQAMFEDPRTYCRPLTRIHCNGGKGTRLGEWVWGPVLYRCGIRQLQDRGFLSPTQYYIAPTDWSFVVDVPGRVEYEMDQMTQWVENDANLTRFHQAVSWCMENNLKTIVFTPNIDMNFRLANVIKGLGGKAECIDSDHDKKATREAKMNAFRAGRFQFLVNVGMVGRGVDVPSVDCVLLCRPTKSLSFYLQAVGRCLRLDPDNPGKTAFVVDLANNVERFGKAEDVTLDQIDAVAKNGWKFKKEVIHIIKNGKQKIWEEVK